MTKFISWLTFILVCVGVLWAGLVYGQEFKTDTENWYQDQIQQDQIQQDQETEDTETEDTNTTITVSATGQILSIQ